MGGEVYGMLSVMERPILDRGNVDRQVDGVFEMESFVDDLQKEINTYLTELSRKAVTEDESKEIFSMIYIVSNLERIGDHCENIAKLCKRRTEYGIEFSEGGREELNLIYHHTLMYLQTIIEALVETPEDLMERVRAYEPQLNAMRLEMRIHHMERLQSAACSADAGLIFVDMLTSFEKIGDHAYNIAESLSGIK